jgi:hypothetical protein
MTSSRSKLDQVLLYLMHETGGRYIGISLDLLHDGHGVGQLVALVPGHARLLTAHLGT